MSKALPWVLAAAYLISIAILGDAFQKIDSYRVDALNLVEESNDLGDSIGLLGLLKVLQVYPEEIQLGLDFETKASHEELALFLPRLNSDARISVNGHAVRQQEYSQRARFEYKPLLVDLPAQILRSDKPNQLRIWLIASGPVMVLSRIYLGPKADLEPAYKQFHFFRQDLIHGALAATGLLSLFLLTIWVVQRRFSEYGWLGLAFLAFSYYLYGFVSETVNSEIQTWSFLVARAIFVVAFVVFVHQFLGVRRRWLELLLAIFFGIVFSVGLILVLFNQYSTFLTLTYMTSLPMVLLTIGYLTVVLALALIRDHHVYLHWLLVGAIFGLVLGIHDVLVLLDVQHWLVRDFYISHYSIVFTVVGYGGVVVHRIAQALFNSEDLNEELGRLLTLRTEELEKSAIEQLQQEKAITKYAERQRIMADMHDGVGGRLVSLIAANRRSAMSQDELTSELDQVLADLRLVLDALTPAGEDLIRALARLRERYSTLLQRAGLELGWDIDPSLDSVSMSPSQTVNILRLVQESLQNVVKHAKATHVSLRLRCDDKNCRLTVEDDGIGIDSDQSGGGYGMTTMVQRAQAVDAELNISALEHGGTRIALKFPRSQSS